MSYAEAIRDTFTGTGIGADGIRDLKGRRKVWDVIWEEMAKAIGIGFRRNERREFEVSSALPMLSYSFEVLSPERKITSSVSTLLSAVEKLFGDSPTDLAKMLRVTRQTVYLYRDQESSQEPSPENRRRLEALATLATESGVPADLSLREALKARQPEGRTLLDCLSDEVLDISALRLMLLRASDRVLRDRLANALARNESVAERSDIMRARHAEGKPITIGDPKAPGELIRIYPDGRRIRGRMVKRQFVPDEE